MNGGSALACDAETVIRSKRWCELMNPSRLAALLLTEDALRTETKKNEAQLEPGPPYRGSAWTASETRAKEELEECDGHFQIHVVVVWETKQKMKEASDGFTAGAQS